MGYDGWPVERFLEPRILWAGSGWPGKVEGTGGQVAGPKEVSRLTLKSSAELTEGPQGGVLDGLLESGQGGAADLQSPGHLGLG